MRETTVRFVLTLLAGLLLVVQSPLPDRSATGLQVFASVIPAAASPAETARESERTYGACGTSERSGEANGLAHPRDRRRSAASPLDPPRRSPAYDTHGALRPAGVPVPGAAHDAGRPVRTPSCPVLQVFRC
ncbi:hypothetical protein ACQSMD_29370 [Streptomyces flavovirens]|uniref:hypothetical protein n=1 Tax=Streptomyces TaxID=1883 RepID=UPI00081B8947|nr:hypothetical protein [Streptomyces sp. BpilaLS-43]MYU35695.1 hypothetical protein [Streptomyces sp. SID8358]MYX75801.1 hypothetical protein [Streptomyces sp. SID3915]SCD53266.1 hypothetical protein GA0115239_103110 [Streptomyces sp. BpilaLS-43]